MIPSDFTRENGVRLCSTEVGDHSGTAGGVAFFPPLFWVWWLVGGGMNVPSEWRVWCSKPTRSWGFFFIFFSSLVSRSCFSCAFDFPLCPGKRGAMCSRWGLVFLMKGGKRKRVFVCLFSHIPKGRRKKKNLRLALLAACRLLVNVFTLHYYFSGWVILWAIAQLWFFAGGAFTKKNLRLAPLADSPLPLPSRKNIFVGGGGGGRGRGGFVVHLSGDCLHAHTKYHGP